MILRTSMFPGASGSLTSTISIVNSFSKAAWTSVPIDSAVNYGSVLVSSGGTTANTLKQLLSISGSGVTMSQLSFRVADATSRTMRVKITVDGIVAFDYTSASITTSGGGCCLAGTARISPSAPVMLIPPIKAKSTLLIEYASSLTETDKIIAEYVYNLEL